MNYRTTRELIIRKIKIEAPIHIRLLLALVDKVLEESQNVEVIRWGEK